MTIHDYNICKKILKLCLLVTNKERSMLSWIGQGCWCFQV